MEQAYKFTLKFAVPVRIRQPNDWIDKLAEAGCDDAIIGTGISASLSLEFDRVADNAELALRSAIEEVQRAIPEARLVEAGPSFDGVKEIAEILVALRQAIRKTMAKNVEEFPLPVHKVNPSIWHLKKV